MNRKKVGILIFPQVEVLDFCGPFEVFSVTRLNEELRREESSPFEVMLVAETTEPVNTTGGMRDYDGFLERGKSTHPLGRVGRPEEIAALVTWLCSDEAGWITGGIHAIDGGRGLTSLR